MLVLIELKEYNNECETEDEIRTWNWRQ